MKKTRQLLTKIIATVALTTCIASASAIAQLPGIDRTDLLKHNLSATGREVIQVRVGFAPGVVAVKHKHPGEEIVYVIEGVFEYQLEGRPAATLKAGDVLFIPAGTPHAVKNIGTTYGVELATYVVEKGKPLITIVK